MSTRESHPEQSQSEIILSLPSKEAIRDFGMEGARQILQDRGFDPTEINICIEEHAPFRIGTVTDATPASVLHNLLRWNQRIGNSGKVQELSRINEAFQKGDAEPLRAELAQQADFFLGRVEGWTNSLPPKNSKQGSVPLFLANDNWRTLENPEQAVAGFYFLENTYNYNVVKRALNQTPEKI